jgi:hypothetical protein
VFDWLFEGRLTVYLILAIPAVILAALWVRDRKRGWLYGMGVVALLLGVYFLLDRIVETRNEQIGRKLQAMAVAVKKRDADAIFQHFSPEFRLGPFDKAGFRKAVENVMRDGGVDDMKIWEVKFPGDPGKVTFKAKPSGRLPGTEMFYLIRAEFVQDDDKQWRLKSFEAFQPYSDSNTPFDVVPYLR